MLNKKTFIIDKKLIKNLIILYYFNIKIFK